MQRFFLMLAISILMVSLLTAAAPTPTVTISLLQGLPPTMNVGETSTVIILVQSDQPFISATALPSFQFPGKGVVAVQGGDREGRDTFARLEVTFLAKSSTARMPGEVAPVFVVVGVRYPGGYVEMREYSFYVSVP